MKEESKGGNNNRRTYNKKGRILTLKLQVNVES